MRVKSITRIAIPLTTAAIVLAACSSGGGGGGSSASGSASGSGASGLSLVDLTPPATAQIDKVTWNLWEGEPYTTDPYTSADYKENTVNSNMCETLMIYDPSYQFKPWLAKAFSNPDPLTWVYDLRDDVTFWDGSKMTTDDVVFSMNKNLTDATSLYHYLYSNVKSVTATGANQVTVKLSAPDYLFNREMADYAGVVVQKKFYEAHVKDVGSPDVGVMCTGPFQFTSWTKGDNLTLTRYDGWWNKEQTPKVKSLVFKFLTDEAAVTAALQTGEIDGSYDPPLSGLSQLATNTTGKLFYGSMPSNVTYTYTNPTGPMANPKMRLALQNAIDWNGIAKVVFKDTAVPIKAELPPTTFDDAKAQLEPAYAALPANGTPDIAKAKALVAEAGADAQKPVIIGTIASATGSAFGNAVVDGAKKAGINATLKVIPVDQYTNYLYDPKTREGVDMLFTDFWSNIPNALDWMGTTSTKGSSFNQWGYSGIDTLYLQARAEKDDTKRGQLTADMMNKLAGENLTMGNGLQRASRLWMNNKITGAPATFTYVYAPWAQYLGGTGAN